jgi:hypothetical protein
MDFLSENDVRPQHFLEVLNLHRVGNILPNGLRMVSVNSQKDSSREHHKWRFNQPSIF